MASRLEQYEEGDRLSAALYKVISKQKVLDENIEKYKTKIKPLELVRPTITIASDLDIRD